MNIKDIRRNNLIALKDKAGGQWTDLETVVGTSANYFRQLGSGHRNVGDKIARMCEAAFNLPNGWMDTPQKPELIVADEAHRGEPRLGLDNVDYLEKAIFEVELICMEEAISLTPHMKAAAITNVYSAAAKSDWALTDSWATAAADSLHGKLQVI